MLQDLIESLVQQVIDRIKQYLVKNSGSTISVDTYLNITESCCNDVVS